MHFVSRGSWLVRSALQWMLLWPCVAWFCYPLLIRGRDRIPARPVVFIANHGSHADTAVVLRALPARIRRRTVVAAAEDHFWRIPSLGGFVSLLTGAFPFPRAGCEGLARAERLLRRGRNVLLFPEGTRANGGRVADFQRGAAILAQRGATIVPIGLHGSSEVLPKGTARPRRAPVSVSFGDPIEPEQGARTDKLQATVARLAAGARTCSEHAAPTFFSKFRSFALSRTAVWVTLGWAFLEALVWPVVPDFLLLPLVLAAPARALVFLGAAAAGSLSGGLVAYLLGSGPLGTGLLEAAPLVTDPMVASAWRTLTEQGPAGLLAQPLSGIPYKAFALQAVPAGLDLPGYVLMSAIARVGRFACVALGGLVLARLLRPFWERFLAPFLALYTLGFSAGLARVVAAWQA